MLIILYNAPLQLIFTMKNGIGYQYFLLYMGIFQKYIIMKMILCWVRYVNIT